MQQSNKSIPSRPPIVNLDNHQERGRLPQQSNHNNNNLINQRDSSLGGPKKAATSHVVCKFFKQGSCTAGSACPFSHEAAQPGSVSFLVNLFPISHL